MANNRIQVKRTSVSGRTANVTNSGNSQYIAAGELALNMPDGILYTSNGSSLIEVGANNTKQNISTNNLTVGNTLYVVANGNVGIGTTPNYRLHVTKTSTSNSGSDSTAYIYARPEQTGTASMAALTIDSSLGSLGSGGFKHISVKQVGGGYPVQAEVFNVGQEGTGYFAGRVGVGIATPAYPGIHVHTATGQSFIHFTREAQGSGGTDGVTFGLGSDSQAYVSNRENTALIFATNNTERMRINAGGFVGIGTSATSYLLDAYNAAAGDASLRFKASNGGSELILDSTNSYASLRYFNSGTEYWRAGMVGSSTAWQVYDYVNSTARIATDNNGAVTLTASADRALTFVRTGTNTFSVEHDSSRLYFYNVTTTSNILTFLNGGNVGVGTANPVAKIHSSIASSGSALLLNSNAGGSGAYVDLEFLTYPTTTLGYVNSAAAIRVIDNGTFAGHITFRTKGNTIDAVQTERMRIDANGNVGINTTTPLRRFHVTANTAGVDGIRVDNRNSGVGVGVETAVELYNTTNFMAKISSFRDTNELRILNPQNGIMSFYTANTERMRIDSNGNVGIGKSPDYKFEVFGSNDIIALTDTRTSSGVGVTFNNSIRFNDFSGAIASIRAIHNGYWVTRELAIDVNGAERIRINGSGSVGIGTTSPGSKLHVYGTSGVLAEIGEGNSGAGFAFHNRLAALPTTGTRINIGWLESTSGFSAGSLLLQSRPAVGSVLLSASGAADVVVDTTGKVGIGTTDLANKLEVFGGSIRVRGIGANPNSSWNGLIINTNDMAGSTGNAGVYLSVPYSAGTVNEGFYRIKRGAGDAYNGSEIAFNNQFRFLGSTTEDTSERMRINSAGRIVINTTSIADGNGARLTVLGNYPETPVEIRQDGNTSHYAVTFRNTQGLIGAIRTQSNDIAFEQIIASGNMTFATGTTERLRITSAGNVGVITGQLYLPATSTRSKIDFYGGGSVYAIGMQSGITFGGLNDWGMTFQFNNAAARGFWWGHDGHTINQGAMALTTDGRLTVAKSIRLGFGESDSVDPGTNYVLEVNGSFAATTKSFVIDHPTKPNHKLRYGSLESPYHGIRLTGEAEVIDGICTVKLPDYIYALCKSEGVNIQLTNIKHGKVLWVDEIDIDNNEFTVATETNGNYKFYWSFTAIRKDIEDMVVEFENNEKE